MVSGLYKSEVAKSIVAKAAINDPIVKGTLEKICSHLKKTQRTSEEIWDKWDHNKDGRIDRYEFVQGFSTMKNELQITEQAAGKLFDALDVDHNGTLTKNEFCTHIDGVQQTREQRVKQLPAEVITDIKY